MATGFGTLLQPLTPRQAVDSRARLLPVAGQLKRASLLARLILSACGMRHRAMFVAGLPPEELNTPLTKSSRPLEAMANTTPLVSIPLPKADHRMPSHLPTWLTGTPVSDGSKPPAYKSLPLLTKALTPTGPLFVPPRGDQLVPFQQAMAPPVTA